MEEPELMLVAERRHATSAGALGAAPGDQPQARPELCQFTRQDGVLHPVVRLVPSEERDPIRSLARFDAAGN